MGFHDPIWTFAYFFPDELVETTNLSILGAFGPRGRSSGHGASRRSDPSHGGVGDGRGRWRRIRLDRDEKKGCDYPSQLFVMFQGNIVDKHKLSFPRWWQLKSVFNVHPEPWGFMIQLDFCILFPRWVGEKPPTRYDYPYQYINQWYICWDIIFIFYLEIHGSKESEKLPTYQMGSTEKYE